MPDPGHVAVFDRIAPVYDDRHGRACAAAHDAVLRYLMGNEVRPGAVLDIGCGTGRLLRQVGSAWPQAALHGIDPAPRMVEVARGQVPAAGLCVGRAEALPYPDGSVDLVLSTTSFGHWTDQAAGLAEVARVLRPGGLCLVVEHLPPNPLVRALYRLAGRYPQLRDAGRMLELVAGAGLRPVCADPIDHGFLFTVASTRSRR